MMHGPINIRSLQTSYTETAKWALGKPISNKNRILDADVYENFTGVLERLSRL